MKNYSTKRLVAFVLLSFFIAPLLPLLGPKPTLASNGKACWGRVIKSGTSTPIAGVKVDILAWLGGDLMSIEMHFTDADGRWESDDDKFTNNVSSIKFEKEGYQTDEWVSYDQPPECEDLTVELQGAEEMGWNCVNPSGSTPEEKCEEVEGGEYSDPDTCVLNCKEANLYKCDKGACVRCDASEDPDNCPYDTSDCDGECPYLTPTPGEEGEGGGIIGFISQILEGTWPEYRDVRTSVGSVIKYGVMIGGGLAVLLIIIGGYKIMTAGGNPAKVGEGRSMIIAAIAGLLLILFSVTIITIIGNILLKGGIPDW